MAENDSDKSLRDKTPKQTEREARLAAALRRNLRRRKAPGKADKTP
jgi:hypothetical protein